MKKYRVTEKHPAYKEGLEIINDTLILSNTDDWGGIFPETIRDWLRSGWIKEIQQPLFTEDDMKSFAGHCLHTRFKSVDGAYDMWIDIKNSKPQKRTLICPRCQSVIPFYSGICGFCKENK